MFDLRNKSIFREPLSGTTPRTTRTGSRASRRWRRQRWPRSRLETSAPTSYRKSPRSSRKFPRKVPSSMFVSSSSKSRRNSMQSLRLPINYLINFAKKSRKHWKKNSALTFSNFKTVFGISNISKSKMKIMRKKNGKVSFSA